MGEMASWFHWHYISHEVRQFGGSWAPYVGSREREKTPDGREQRQYLYTYVLKDGTVQQRVATVYVARTEWRLRCLRWTRLFRNVRTAIYVAFNEEVGEETGSWKAGCVGCGYEMKRNESMEQCLRRMELERKF